MYTIIGMYITGGLLILAVLAMLISGIRGLFMAGANEAKKIGIFLIPFIVFIVAYFVTHDLARAGSATMLVMLAVMALAILVSGLRSTFNF